MLKFLLLRPHHVKNSQGIQLPMIPLINLGADVKCIFRERINRFLGTVDIDSPALENEKVHIHDPGRLEDLLYRNNEVLLKEARGKGRKTDWDIIAGYDAQNKCWVPVHSGYHSRIAERILENEKTSPFGKIERIKSEVAHERSRLDFLVTAGGEKIWVEVKGCTLARDGVSLFPDAPTKRGTKHLKSLMDAVGEGDMAAVMFLVFRRDAKCFSPNEEMDPEFAKTFREAMNAGVEIHAFRLIYEKGTVYFDEEIPICNFDGLPV